MSNALDEVLADRQYYLDGLEKARTRMTPIALFERARMDGAFVVPDNDMRRIFKLIYTYGMNFAPGGLCGMGMSTGDIRRVRSEDLTLLSFDIGVMAGNHALLALARQHEHLIVGWKLARDFCEESVLALLAELGSIEPAVSNFLESMQSKMEAWDHAEMGMNSVPAPNPDLLRILADVIPKLRESGRADLAQRVSSLRGVLEPFAEIPKAFNEIRTLASHKGYPCFTDGLLTVSTPAHSGRASVVSYAPSDDPRDALPSASLLFFPASQSGMTGVAHLDGPENQGQLLIFLPPREGILDRLQHAVQHSPDVQALFSESVAPKSDDPLEAADTLFTVTSKVRREVLDPLLATYLPNRVLGMLVDYTVEPGTVVLRPIVSQGTLEQAECVKDGFEVVSAPWSAIAIDTGSQYHVMSENA